MAKKNSALKEIRKEWLPTTPAGYPPRCHVALHEKSWSKKAPNYAAIDFTAPSVIANALGPASQRYADPAYLTPEAFSEQILSGQMKSHEGTILQDPVTGAPLNPVGRTGIKGRGAWGKWGPNHAADALLIRENAQNGRLEALLIQRKTGEWALPGGMLNKAETGRDAALRELQEETSITITNVPTYIAFEGAVRKDPRDTDNAWAETTLAVSFVGRAGMDLFPKAQDDAAHARWFDINEEILPQLFSNHGSLVRTGIKRLQRALGAPFTTTHQAQLGSLFHEPLLPILDGLKGRIGIFGGTFDPIHFSHLKLAKAAQEWHNLDYVIFIPALQNPLKSSPAATPLERLMMIREALSHQPSWYVSPVQLRNEHLRYTAELLGSIRAKVDPHATLFTLVGADCIESFPEWKDLASIRALSTIVPVYREGVDLAQTLHRLPRELQAELSQSIVPASIPPYAASAIRSSLKGAISTPRGLLSSTRNFLHHFKTYAERV